MLQWKRHLGEYRSDKGYTVRSPQRGSYWTLLAPGGLVHGRYPKLESAKLAAEQLELHRIRQEHQIGRNGHEVFDSLWGCYDLTVARQLIQQHGQPDWLHVKDWADAAGSHPICTEQPAHDGPIIVLTTNRRGLTTSLVIDGYARILQAQVQGTIQLECLVLDEFYSELVKISVTR
jgi:hypothetical protein